MLAAYLPVGTRYFGVMFANRDTAYDELATGGLRWGEKTWEVHNVLVLVRPGDAYSVMGFWNEQGVFVGWYVNLQDPMRWTPSGYDTRDHTLDLIVGEDLASWMWKDEPELDKAVEMGLYSAEEAAGFRATGEAVIDLVDRGETWWGDWRGFEPDPSWEVPVLPSGWDSI